MLSKEAIDDFKSDWYTFEEIQRINESLESIEKGEWLISFEDLIAEYLKDNKIDLCWAI
jgi:hypothetical protein